AKPDWEAIESVYRAGSLSIREIPTRYRLPCLILSGMASGTCWQAAVISLISSRTWISGCPRMAR
ncbi:hypothetical protein FE394_19260, partial [Xenorhabdus sp. Reich]|nr:hypothetical protein [Xenorhabdus sp. Reich]